MNIENFLDDPGVLRWLQSLVDCPPGRLRSGYQLLTEWWQSFHCGHAMCVKATGCVLMYPTACRDVGDALDELVEVGMVAPVGASVTVPGHTTKASGPDISRVRSGVRWGERIHEPAYIFLFESGDRLPAWLACRDNGQTDTCP